MGSTVSSGAERREAARGQETRATQTKSPVSGPGFLFRSLELGSLQAASSATAASSPSASTSARRPHRRLRPPSPGTAARARRGVTQDWGCQPEVKWQRPPSLPTTSSCLPQVERRPARIETVKPRQVPWEKPEAGFTADLLRRREMAGTDCRLKRRLCRKRIAVWKTFFFSSC